MAIETGAGTPAGQASNTAGLKKDGTPKAKRGEGKGAQPRPAYIIYNPLKDEGGNFNGDFEVVEVTRKSDVLLGKLDENRDLKYKKFAV